MKMKVPYNIRKSLARVLPFAMLMGVPVMNSCEKEPGRTVTIDWDWEHFPRSDTVKLCAKQKDVDSIILNLRDYPSYTWSPWSFHNACDALEKVFNIAPNKTRGHGTIFVGSEGGAQMSSTEPGQGISGMGLLDSIRCTSWGFKVTSEPLR